jgi:hypothetical protein
MTDIPEQEKGSRCTDDRGGEGKSADKDKLQAPARSGPEEMGRPSPTPFFPASSLTPDDWTLDLSKPKSSSAGPDKQDVLDEIADDLLELMKRTTAIEAQLRSISVNLYQLTKSVESAARGHAIEIERLKESLISDRKEFIGRGTFNAIRPAIESLNFMMEAYRNRPEDEALLRQTGAVHDLLTGIGFPRRRFQSAYHGMLWLRSGRGRQGGPCGTTRLRSRYCAGPLV